MCPRRTLPRTLKYRTHQPNPTPNWDPRQRYSPINPGLLCDLLWSDPDKSHQGWGENQRGISYTFGEDVVQFIIMKFKLDLICRGHQIVADGYEFFAKKKLATIFSAPNYMGAFDNSGGVMCVNEQLMCSFQILKPTDLINNYPVSSQNRPGTPNPPKWL